MNVFRLNRPTLSLRWAFPDEGWAIVLLQAALLVNSAVVVGRSDWVEVPASLAAVAVCGGILGYVLAKTSCPDVIAHLTAAIVGLWAIGLQVLVSFSELGGSRRDRFAELIDRARVWYRGTTSGNQHDDTVLFAFALAFTLWLVSYLAVWTLLRRRWLLVSILLPGFLVLVTLGYSPELGSRPLIVALLLSGMLSALYFAYRRDQVWRRFRIPSPQGIARRVSTVGTVLVVAVLVLAWSLPRVTSDRALENIRDRVQGSAEAINFDWLEAVPNLADNDGASADNYAAFGDAFELGGGVSLGDEPAFTLRGTGDPQYLVGLRYDVYTGHGWESGVAGTFNPDGPDGPYSPQLTYLPQQDVALSDDFVTQSEPITGIVTVLRPRGTLLFTLDTFRRIDLPTSVQLSWLQLEDQPYRLRSEEVPIDLWPLASLLISEDDYGSGITDANGSPLPDDEETATRITTERQRLLDRFLATRWEMDETGVITLFVSGQVPVYDDIEAVFARGPVAGGTRYEVTGLESRATPGELREAGAEYPDYVRERYLALPDSVTQRTKSLAGTLVGEQTNNFDIAQAIELDVRKRIDYSLDIELPPSGQDVVDYVLFDSQIGYCEYHASAMAVLLRAAGIPSRVAVGYHQVAFDPTTEAFTYLESDAHAWVEAYFPGYGWIPFEPTPSEPLREYGSDDSDSSEALTLPTTTPTPQLDETPVPSEEAAQESSPTPTPPAPAINQATRTGSGGGDWRDWAPWAIVGGLLGLSSLAWFAWNRPYRGLSPAGVLIFQTARFGRWLGVRRDPTLTPDEFAAELGRVVPAARAPAQHVARLYAAERYGGEPLSREQHRSGERALRHLRRSYLRSLFRRQSRTDRSNRGER